MTVWTNIGNHISWSADSRWRFSATLQCLYLNQITQNSEVFSLSERISYSTSSLPASTSSFCTDASCSPIPNTCSEKSKRAINHTYIRIFFGFSRSHFRTNNWPIRYSPPATLSAIKISVTSLCSTTLASPPIELSLFRSSQRTVAHHPPAFVISTTLLLSQYSPFQHASHRFSHHSSLLSPAPSYFSIHHWHDLPDAELKLLHQATFPFPYL